jgi:hypothetical protein
MRGNSLHYEATGEYDKHGLSKHPLYKTWNNMTQRANKHKNYIGIYVCDEWLSFVNFYQWSVSNGWSEGLEIDRLNNNLGYNPDNCRWATRQEQMRNTSRNKYFTYKGEDIMIVDICNKYNINRNTFNKRLRLGWSIDRIIETPLLDRRERMLGSKLSDQTKAKISERLKKNNNRVKNKI